MLNCPLEYFTFNVLGLQILADDGNSIDGCFASRTSNSEPKPLLIKLVLSVDHPVVYALIGSRVDRGGRIAVGQSKSPGAC